MASGLIDDIPGAKERQVILRLVWGYKQVEIHEMLGVSKPYVSQVINKWTQRWGWTQADIYQAQLLLFTHQVAKCYRQKERKYWSPVPDVQKADLEHKKQIEYAYRRFGVLEAKEDPEVQELYHQIHGVDQKASVIRPNALDVGIELHKEIVGSTATRHYFYDLQMDDMASFLQIADEFCSRWFGPPPDGSPYLLSSFIGRFSTDWGNYVRGRALSFRERGPSDLQPIRGDIFRPT